MRKFYLVDFTHNKEAKRQEKLYMVAANMALKYGHFGINFGLVEDIKLQEFWDGDDCPSSSFFKKYVRVSSVKWYIHNKIDLSKNIWNGDFLHGLCTTGKIKWAKRFFPSLTWRCNQTVFDLLRDSGFGGILKRYICKKDKNRYRWSRAPALYLKHDETSSSFMAGVLASGILCEKDGYTYAKYNSSHKKFFEKWSIPIESEDEDGRYCWLSPIWGALFTPKMPEGYREKWLNLKNTFGRDIYPPILWKTYVSNKFVRGGIPYLKSRRWIFNHYKSEDGAMKILEKERVGKNLTEIDKRVREMVHEWQKKEINNE